MKFININELQKYPIRINHYDEENGNIDFVLGVEHVIEYAENLPQTELTYCKDCKWATERTKDNAHFKYQCRNMAACGLPRRDVDFCSYGIPK